MTISNKLYKFYSCPSSLTSFHFFQDNDDLVYPRNFRIFPFFATSRLFFQRGNQLKSFIVKPYHFFSLSGNFVFTRYQSKAIHIRAKRKKSATVKKRR